MTIEKCLDNSCKRLKGVGIQTARLDSLILLEDILGKDRSWLLAHPDHIVRGSTSHKLQEQIERRARHEPLAYIRGRSEFYGRELLVTPDTLEPRPETETMVDLLKQIMEDGRWKMEDKITVVDVGTGSGCIAITAKLEFPELEVVATEINPAALKIAQKNAKKLDADVIFYQGNLLDPVSRKAFAKSTNVESEAVFSSSSGAKRTNSTMREQRRGKTGYGPQVSSRIASSAREPATDGSWILLANLPYVPDSHTINEAAMHEPKIAIFGGPDGLDLYRELFMQIANYSQFPEYILTESLPFQHKELAKIAKKAGYKLVQTEDFIQLFSPSALPLK